MANPDIVVGHLTDLHVVAPGERLFDLNTTASAEAAVARVAGMRPTPDAVIVTGDVTAHGDPEECATARRVLDRLGVPYYVVPGNHDRRAPLVEAFADICEVEGGFMQYAVDVGDVRLVGLDTLQEGNDAGRLCDGRVEWLDAALAVAPTRPTVVFLHHPPFVTGISWMDSTELVEAEQFAAVLDRHPQVELVACGHVHRSITTTLGHARVALGPSTAFEVHLDLGAGPTPMVVEGPPAYLVHRHTTAGWVTHMALANTPPPIDITERPAYGSMPT